MLIDDYNSSVKFGGTGANLKPCTLFQRTLIVSQAKANTSESSTLPCQRRCRSFSCPFAYLGLSLISESKVRERVSLIVYAG